MKTTKRWVQLLKELEVTGTDSMALEKVTAAFVHILAEQ